jgi:hypothetical protein
LDGYQKVGQTYFLIGESGGFGGWKNGKKGFGFWANQKVGLTYFLMFLGWWLSLCEGRGGGIEIFIWREMVKSRYKCADIHCEIFATKFSQFVFDGGMVV